MIETKTWVDCFSGTLEPSVSGTGQPVGLLYVTSFRRKCQKMFYDMSALVIKIKISKFHPLYPILSATEWQQLDVSVWITSMLFDIKSEKSKSAVGWAKTHLRWQFHLKSVRWFECNLTNDQADEYRWDK